MSPGGRKHSKVVAEFAAEVLADLDRGSSVRRKLPFGGRLFIDRALPFLCVYRRPTGRPDAGTGRLVASEASFLVAPGDEEHRASLAQLVLELCSGLSERLGAVLLLELWTASRDAVEDSAVECSPTPGFKLVAAPGAGVDHTLDDLDGALRRVRILKHPASIERERSKRVAPPGMRPLLTRAEARRCRCELVGLEVQPVFRSPGGETYPLLLRRLRRLLSTALRRGFHRFSLTHSQRAPVSYQALGRRTVKKEVWAVDRRLAELAQSYDFLFEVTPVNLERAWSRFRRSRFERPPVFYYRPLPIDPLVVKRKLFEIPLARIEDPVLADLFREKQLSVDRELTMLVDRGTSRFCLGSQQVFGGVAPALLATARQLLEHIPPRPRRERARKLDAAQFAERARAEIERYRSVHPAFSSQVQLRDDIYAGLMVSRGNLLVGRNARFGVSRVEALLSHEVGTHCLTFHNGRAQPFRQLSVGLPGYDELQEGLAVLAEYLAGGLDRIRLRLLAGRVVAVRLLLDGAAFVEAFRELHRTHGFTQYSSFTVAARVYRGGGLTKDAVYLRGLDRILGYLRKGGRLDPLFVGKIAARHVPIVEELQLRGVLRPIPLQPRYLESEPAVQRLERLRGGQTILDLLEGAGR